MSPKKMGIVTGVALAGAGALCARHIRSQPQASPGNGCPCTPGKPADGHDQQGGHACSPQEVRDAA